MLWTLPIIPICVGLLVWLIGRRWTPPRLLLGGIAAATTATLGGLAGWAVSKTPTTSFDWGPGLVLQLQATTLVGAMALVVPSIALAVLLWASAHEDRDRLARLIGLVLAFVGSMELLVLAADLLTLIVGWELVGALSWALIGHRLGDNSSRKDAAFAYNATRLGGLGLFLAAGAAVAQTGSFAFADLNQVATSAWGSLFGAGVLLAAVSKSAQLPFSPWLFRAMAGPTSVSALLHSSTMVAAGAWVLIRLHEPLSRMPWFGDAAIAIGLTTAVAGGIVAAVQPRAKRLLAASTSAHYGFIFAAVGAGATSAAFAHLVTHAAFKSLLFLVAGTAMGVAGSHKLRDMTLGRLLPTTAIFSGIAALALAGIPPMGGGWSKEKILAALGHIHPALAGVGIVAGALSAWYAVRFHVLAYGRDTSGSVTTNSVDANIADDNQAKWPGLPEKIAMGLLALVTVGLSLLWVPSVAKTVAHWFGFEWPHAQLWEQITASAAAVLAAAGAWFVYRPDPGVASTASKAPKQAADWLALPTLIDRLVTRPTLALAGGCARFDDRLVDAGVRGAAKVAQIASIFADRSLEASVELVIKMLGALSLRSADASRIADDAVVDRLVEATGRAVGRAARPVQRTQTGALPRYYIYVTAGLFIVIVFAFFWR